MAIEKLIFYMVDYLFSYEKQSLHIHFSQPKCWEFIAIKLLFWNVTWQLDINICIILTEVIQLCNRICHHCPCHSKMYLPNLLLQWKQEAHNQLVFKGSQSSISPLQNRMRYCRSTEISDAKQERVTLTLNAWCITFWSSRRFQKHSMELWLIRQILDKMMTICTRLDITSALDFIE